MSDLIQLLPDSVANQIAAGEVVQRPASVLKELVENSIDAGSTKIQVVLKDAGKTLIQVIDNGCGMSETDARMCFERHATSKIRQAMDLFNIKTMGFRGEAMASIAAVAHIELKTKQQHSEIGTLIRIAGSKVETQEPTNCQNGTNITVKNLFFNVPARRKFLSTNSTELKHLMEFFQRIALGFPEIQMQLIHNDQMLYDLPASKIFSRIVNILGKSVEKNLIPVQSETSMAKIIGYVGKPEYAKKRAGEQFFFVNKRFMKHPYFFKAVLSAYQNILLNNSLPLFFIYFDINPDAIDINIHPTKTEIKFENERALWSIIEATVKEGLGKFNIVPSLDFEQESVLEVPILKKNDPVILPEVKVNPLFNPFQANYKRKTPPTQNWEQLYKGFEKHAKTIQSDIYKKETPAQTFLQNQENSYHRFFQIKGKYIASVIKSGLMLIDQKRAHERILFDEYIGKSTQEKALAQKLLYPQNIKLEAVESELFKSVIDEINNLGFEVKEITENNFEISSIPAHLPNQNLEKWIDNIIENLKNNDKDFKCSMQENLITTLAKFLSIPYGKKLSEEEMTYLNDKLFGSSMPNLTPDNKKILNVIPIEEIEKKFK